MADNDDIHDALSDGERRRLLVSLLDHNPQDVRTLSGASRELARADEGLLRSFLADSRPMVDVDERLLRKHAIHIPKLVEYGFVEWDREEHVVTKGPRFDEIRPLLERLVDDPDALPHEWA